MKVLHSNLNQCIDNYIGIADQMYGELCAAKDLGINYDVKYFTTNKTSIKARSKYRDLLYIYTPSHKLGILSQIQFRQAYYKWLDSMQDDVDCFVLRYIPSDPLQYLFIKNSKKPVCLIHHTKELTEMNTNKTIKNFVKKIIENSFGRLSIRASHITCGVTKEIANYELNRAGIAHKKILVKPNAIYLSDEVKLRDARQGDVPIFLFVASRFSRWHGLDLLIDAVIKTDKNLKVHLVGDILPEDSARLLKTNKFETHGRLTPSEIKTLSEECWVGIGSLALFRKDLKDASTLKVRNYLSLGLPVYSGYSESFPKNFIYYREKPEAGVDINSLIDFAIRMRRFSKHEVRQQSAEFISMHSTTKRFYESLVHIL